MHYWWQYCTEKSVRVEAVSGRLYLYGNGVGECREESFNVEFGWASWISGRGIGKFRKLITTLTCSFINSRRANRRPKQDLYSVSKWDSFTNCRQFRVWPLVIWTAFILSLWFYEVLFVTFLFQNSNNHQPYITFVINLNPVRWPTWKNRLNTDHGQQPFDWCIPWTFSIEVWKAHCVIQKMQRTIHWLFG